MSVSETWGTDADEQRLSFSCDALIGTPDAQLYRGITINAPPELVFRWLCQLRVAPYSYDWIDNGGRQSPHELTPGLEQLEVGQDVMTIFTLTEFAHNRHLTIRIKPQRSGRMLFGDIAVTYLIVPKSHVGKDANGSCRLLVKLVVKYPASLKGRLMSKLLPWGDLIMMRRQLMNLKQLAEKN
ncbi:MAG: hypothetical protein ACR2LM_11610 [Pyrinomonadaceae bacterium]